MESKETVEDRRPRMTPYNNIRLSDIPIQTTDTHICDYTWLIMIATCFISLCTALLVIIFFIWAATTRADI